MPISRRPLSERQEEELRAALLQQATTGLEDKKIARRVGCSLRTLHRRKRALADELAPGRDPEAERMTQARHRHAGGRIAQALLRATAGNGGDGGLRGILDAFPDLGVLTDDEKERLLTILAHKAPPNVQVQAVKLLDELQRARRPQERIGPPPPLTSEERIARLKRLTECVEDDEWHVVKAWRDEQIGARGSSTPISAG